MIVSSRGKWTRDFTAGKRVNAFSSIERAAHLKLELCEKLSSAAAMSDSELRQSALVDNRNSDADFHRQQAEALRAAETRTLEMIADGTRLPMSSTAYVSLSMTIRPQLRLFA